MGGEQGSQRTKDHGKGSNRKVLGGILAAAVFLGSLGTGCGAAQDEAGRTAGHGEAESGQQASGQAQEGQQASGQAQEGQQASGQASEGQQASGQASETRQTQLEQEFIQEREDNRMTQERIETAMKKAKEYIEAMTIDSDVNIPAEIVADEKKYFTWDNEKRTPGDKPYLFDWSYYNGVVMEGLLDIYETDPEANAEYLDYVKEYLDAMIVTDGKGQKTLSPNLAGYVDYHGADCYKTANVLLRASDGTDDYMQICRDLYRDLTDSSYVNSKGHIVSKEYTEEALGYNYWHSWADNKAPAYKVWLDGIYMLQPFISRCAKMTDDREQLELVQKRLDWVNETLAAPNGMYYHAANSADDVCAFHWTRAMGWYGMAMVDVMEVMPSEFMEERKAALKTFVDGMLKYQDESGMWANVADWEVTETNRLEVSGTSMMVYIILKGVRNGWLDESYQEYAVKAFVAMTEMKLDEDGLHDIYFKATANNTNNYEDPAFYLTDEGKGSGPFIMAYSEMLRMK